MIRVWSDGQVAGALDRVEPIGSAFAYDPRAPSNRAVSMTMPVRLESWNERVGLAPIFDMNLPEGALRERLVRRFAKATGSFDDVDLLAVVGRAQIGRVRYTGFDELLNESVPFQSVDEILRARRDGGLFEHLVEQFAASSGISGVQPKVMIRGTSDKLSDPRGRQSPSVMSATHIVKLWDANEFPELAANEFLCLEVAGRVGLTVPKYALSDDGGALVVERFDRDGEDYLGFEDFCVLNGLQSREKYKGSYETALFKRASQFLGDAWFATEARALFTLVVLNCALRNGDAHLKNFGVLYRAVDGEARLAPVYDIVTTTVYLEHDRMALVLDGSSEWPTRERLIKLGTTRAGLAKRDAESIVERVADAIADTRPRIGDLLGQRAPAFAAQLASTWDTGVAATAGRV